MAFCLWHSPVPATLYPLPFTRYCLHPATVTLAHTAIAASFLTGTLVLCSVISTCSTIHTATSTSCLLRYACLHANLPAFLVIPQAQGAQTDTPECSPGPWGYKSRYNPAANPKAVTPRTQGSHTHRTQGCLHL